MLCACSSYPYAQTYLIPKLLTSSIASDSQQDIYDRLRGALVLHHHVVNAVKWLQPALV